MFHSFFHHTFKLFAAFALLCGGASLHADSPARNSSNLSREFSVVPTGDVLYSHLDALRNSGWVSSSRSAATMTRYEMALEVTKALITIRARNHADPRAMRTVPAASLRALRALCTALQTELARFDIDSKSTIAEIDSWLKPSPETGTATTPAITTSATNSRISGVLPVSFSGTTTPNRETALLLPLSQRLRVYGAVASIARATSDPLHNMSDATPGSLRLGDSGSQTFSRAGATLALNSWLQLRGDVSRQPAVNNVSQALGNSVSTSAVEGERSFGGGVDIHLRPGVILSGGVSRFQSNGGLMPGLSDFNGTRYAGGLELSGWENRVALSANLSRLVPEDSLAFSITTAQLNLGVGLTEQVSLKLLYQQLFDAPQQSRNNRVLAGGININF